MQKIISNWKIRWKTDYVFAKWLVLLSMIRDFFLVLNVELLVLGWKCYKENFSICDHFFEWFRRKYIPLKK